MQAVRSYLQGAGTDPAGRARLLLDITCAFYDFTKFSAPGGEGMDRRDGPERYRVSGIMVAADKHLIDTALPIWAS